MLNMYPRPTADKPAIWLDLLAASDEERDKAAAIFGSPLPTREALSEIQNSSRMRSRDGVLYMSIPSAAPAPPGERPGSPIGFMLSCDHLVTVRFQPLPSFDAVAGRCDSGEVTPTSSLEVFVEICEEIVDRVADALEQLAEELAPLSEAAFHVDDVQGRKANLLQPDPAPAIAQSQAGTATGCRSSATALSAWAA